jgi:hypothetical protein
MHLRRLSVWVFCQVLPVLSNVSFGWASQRVYCCGQGTLLFITVDKANFPGTLKALSVGAPPGVVRATSTCMPKFIAGGAIFLRSASLHGLKCIPNHTNLPFAVREVAHPCKDKCHHKSSRAGTVAQWTHTNNGDMYSPVCFVFCVFGLFGCRVQGG